MRIKKLSSLVASQIAAGEVIERPASVLKELLENSIDAGSTKITVELEQGGVGLIRVRDDGIGIYKEELELALVQHATSKISTVQDLNNIDSLGFRGEALASIAAVSKLKLSSKPKEQDMGWELKVNDNNNVSPCSQQDGTTITVENLFYNIPARRKFLRSERTEFNYIDELLKRIALSHFNIALTLFHNGRKLKHLPVCKDEIARIKRVERLCGSKFIEESIYIEAEQNNLKLSGWLGIPEYAKNQAGNQYFYINNRMIKDRLINHAIKQSYQFYCDPHKYPNYCLYFELDPTALDVNVHPTKHEVRFRAARIIHGFLTKIIQDGLEKQRGNDTAQEDIEVIDTIELESLSQQFNSKKIVQQFGNTDKIPFTKMPLKIANKKITEVVRECEIEDEDNVAEKETQVLDNESNEQKDIVSNATVNNANKIEVLCIIGKNKLILAEYLEKIILIDIKLALEQLLNSKLEKLFIKNNSIPNKSLLMPEIVSFNKDVGDIMKYADLFATFGFQIDQTSPQDILVRTIPEPLCEVFINYKYLIEQLVQLCKEFNVKEVKEFIKNNIFIAKSIKIIISFLRFKESIDEQEALQLVQELICLQLPISHTCGREKLSFKQFSLEEFQEIVYRG